jgi:PIN domain nuclease of toxin-antitoxin system
VRLLLDTHAVVWWWTGHAALPEHARATIADPRHEVWVSAASAWEIGIKHHAGRWPDAAAILDRWDALTAEAGFTPLAISAAQARRAAALDWPHRDPFDRLLAAQAQAEGLMLATADAAVRAFLGEVFWLG